MNQTTVESWERFLRDVIQKGVRGKRDKQEVLFVIQIPNGITEEEFRKGIGAIMQAGLKSLLYRSGKGANLQWQDLISPARKPVVKIPGRKKVEEVFKRILSKYAIDDLKAKATAKKIKFTSDAECLLLAAEKLLENLKFRKEKPSRNQMIAIAEEVLSGNSKAEEDVEVF